MRHEQCMSMRHFAECFLSWNFGLHLLHMYPARPVPTVSLRCALSYGELVHSSLHELQRAAPTARLVWRTTNAVCDSGFVGDWHDVIHAYSGSGSASYQLPSARRVRERCTRRYNVSEAVCEQTVMNRQNTLAQQRLALKALSDDPGVGVLDAFALTDGQCTSTADGRHYPNLLARINTNLLQELARAA